MSGRAGRRFKDETELHVNVMELKASEHALNFFLRGKVAERIS